MERDNNGRFKKANGEVQDNEIKIEIPSLSVIFKWLLFFLIVYCNITKLAN